MGRGWRGALSPLVDTVVWMHCSVWCSHTWVLLHFCWCVGSETESERASERAREKVGERARARKCARIERKSVRACERARESARERESARAHDREGQRERDRQILQRDQEIVREWEREREKSVVLMHSEGSHCQKGSGGGRERLMKWGDGEGAAGGKFEHCCTHSF